MLTHLALLKPALQAWWVVWGGPNQVLTHLALLRSALQAWCGHRGPSAGFGAWYGPQGLVLLVGLAHVCDSGLKGRFPVAQGAALGLEPPKKLVFRPEGPISRRVLFSPSCTGFQVLTSLALLKPVLQAWWAGDVWAVAGACFVCTVPAFASQARNAVFRKGS